MYLSARSSGAGGAVAFFALLALSRLASAGLVFKNESISKDIYAPVLRFYGGVVNFSPITSNLELENDTAAAFESPPRCGTYRAGSIVVAVGNPWRSFFTWIRACALPQNVSAVVLVQGSLDKSIGLAEFLTAPHDTRYPIPVTTISVATYSRLVKNISAIIADGGDITVTMDSSGGITPWRFYLTSPSWWFFSILVSLISCGVAALALLRLWAYQQSLGKFAFGVPQIVLLTEFAAATLRFLYWSIDPLGQRSLVPQVMHTPWRTFSFPFTITSMLVLIFYWHEALHSSSIRVSWSIDKFKVPCSILIALTFIAEISSDILFFTGADAYGLWLIDYLVPAYYLIVGTCLGLFFIITSIKILFAISRITSRKSSTLSSATSDPPSSPSSASASSPSLSRNSTTSIARKLIAMGVFYLCAVFTGFYTLSDELINYVPNHYIYPWVVLHSFLNLKAVATIFVLVPKAPAPTSSTRQSVSV